MKYILPSFFICAFIALIVGVVYEGQYSVHQHYHTGIDGRNVLITQVIENFPWALTNCPPVIEVIDDLKDVDSVLVKQRKKEADNFIKILKDAE